MSRLRLAAWYMMWVASTCYALLACSGSADRARRGDSAAGSVAAVAGSVTLSAPRASDATLVIQTTPALLETLRAVTDSFAAREAIRVVFAPDAGSAGGGTTLMPGTDLVVLTGLAVPRLMQDSTFWTLPFAESRPLDPGPAAVIDSVARADSARAARSRGRSRGPAGRRADSIRADSARRVAEGVRLHSARADSARTLVLTIPADAPNSSVAERFVRYLLTDGRATLLRSGVHVLPLLVLRGDGAPLGIRAVVDTFVSGDTVDKTTPDSR